MTANQFISQIIALFGSISDAIQHWFLSIELGEFPA
jgi:hypothetical protein